MTCGMESKADRNCYESVRTLDIQYGRVNMDIPKFALAIPPFTKKQSKNNKPALVIENL